MNVGKIFEANWKLSCSDDILIYRPPDAVQSFNATPNSKLRFSQHSPADFFMFDGYKFIVLELKSFKGSCSFERAKTDKGIIHYYQIESLQKFAGYRNVISGFLLDFRTTSNTYFVDIGQFSDMIKKIDKKSFNESDLLNFCDPIKIEKRKLKVNYRYDVKKFFSDLE